jgi:hypothetical protein
MAALEGFVPEIWAGTALERLYKSLVYGSVANRDYEGEISQFGDTVRINQVGIVNVADYVSDSTTITPQTLDDAQKQLKIDQQKYFSFKIDDVAKAQTKPKVMSTAMTDAGFRLGDQADQYLASLWTEAGITDGLGTAAVPIDITSVNVIEYLSLVSQKMDENNVPYGSRWGVIPPWFHQKIVLSNLTLDTDNSEMFRNGFIGRAMGFTLYVSNNVVTAASNQNSKIMFGYSGTMTFAEQILSMEAYRPESSFSDAVKGLYVYGAKVTRPDALALLTADYTAEP